MRTKHRQSGNSFESSNVPGNPLRSYRMSMLAHGFVDDSDSPEFSLDETDPMSYSVVRMRNQTAPIAAVVMGLVVILIVIAAIYLT